MILLINAYIFNILKRIGKKKRSRMVEFILNIYIYRYIRVKSIKNKVQGGKQVINPLLLVKYKSTVNYKLSLGPQ